MSETLEGAIRQAKIRAGLDPELKHSPAIFWDSIEPKWRQPFARYQLQRVLDAEEATK